MRYFQMNFIQSNNAKTVLFISGMFAGNWIWNRCHGNITDSFKLMIEEPLCAISNNIDELTTQICEHLDSIPEPVTIVGNSLGSFIGLRVAQHSPKKVKQVLISGSAGFGDVGLDVRLSRDKADEIAKYLMNLICHDKNMVSEEDTQKTADSFRNNLKNIVGLIRESNSADGEELLKSIKCPVHAVWGAQDIITPPNEVRSIFENLGLSFELLENCGHSPMYERPEEFADWVNQRLAS